MGVGWYNLVKRGNGRKLGRRVKMGALLQLKPRKKDVPPHPNMSELLFNPNREKILDEIANNYKETEEEKEIFRMMRGIKLTPEE